MRLYLVKEAPGQYAAALFSRGTEPYKPVALFRTERDARRFINAAEKSMTAAEEAERSALKYTPGINL